jgi:hypothetical protein
MVIFLHMVKVMQTPASARKKTVPNNIFLLQIM